MKSTPPALVPLLRSDAQGEILAALLLRADREWTVTELARFADTSVPTASREVERLVAGGLVTVRDVGRARCHRANESHRLFRPLREIIDYGYGPAHVLEEQLRDVPGVEEAYIHGSWAARRRGVLGPDPADIDVIIVGNADRAALDAVAQAVEHRVGRDIDVQLIRPRRWADLSDPFVQTIRSRELVALDVVGSME